MKKILLILLAAVILSGCYTTLYPPVNMDMSAANDIPDSTRQVIINNYYETTEYYEVPRYHRYSLLWDSYYYDPFYYDYSYYNWRPYYWYGHYYYYNPHNHYWYYYDRHHHGRRGNWTGGSSGGQNDKGRISKPGYSVLTSTPTGGSVPFVSSTGTDNSRISKQGKKVGVDLNSGVNNNDGYYTSSKPRVQSVGKKPVSSSGTVSSMGKSSSSSHKATKSSSTSTYKAKKQTSSSSSSNRSASSTKSSKPSNTSSTSNKNSRSESSSSSSKKSK